MQYHGIQNIFLWEDFKLCTMTIKFRREEEGAGGGESEPKL